MTAVFREVRRVLKDDGTLWLNLGDSYATHGGCKGSNHSHNFRPPEVAEKEGIYRAKPFGKQIGLKEKDLIGIPWRVAFALQADGWYLRQDIIWHKPNPMPESVTDRCTKSHEYVFLMSKSAKYYYDAEAIAEVSIYYGKDKRSDMGNIRYEGKRTQGDVKQTGQQSFVTINETRNRRSVWTIPTKPFMEAHFATYPPDLIKPMVLAGCLEGGIILDPFMGSGTTAVVARSLGRHFVGIDLNNDNKQMAERRVGETTPSLFMEVTV